MSQHDYIIANDTGANVRSDLNNALAAIASNNSGSAEPTTTYAFQWWYDTTNNLLKLRNSANSAWITMPFNPTTGSIEAPDGSEAAPSITNSGDTNTGIYFPDADTIALVEGGVERMRISSSGNVGIGTDDPKDRLHVFSGSSGASSFAANTDVIIEDNLNAALQFCSPNTTNQQILFSDPESNVSGVIQYNHTDDVMSFNTDGTQRVVFTSAGRVGIGTENPLSTIQMESSSGTSCQLRMLTGDTTSNCQIIFGDSADDNVSGIHYYHSDETMRFLIANTGEKARFDSSGNFLVGTDSANPSGDNVTGCALGNVGQIDASYNGTCLDLNRTASDGNVINLRSAGTVAMRLGVNGGDGYAGTGDTCLLYANSVNSIYPFNSDTLTGVDNVIDLGYSSYRFDDIRATNPTIVTSDRNLKQDIASLTNAEMNVAKALSSKFINYRWIDSVEKKGDSARTHSGIIAQDVEAAFEAEGLDAGKYALFIRDVWWEKEIDVPAVPASDAVYETQTDEEGNVTRTLVSEAYEGNEAYTRTNVYPTLEEAPEGAVERTRLGVRYPELLAFIAAYNDQRFSDIESRLAALES